MIRPGVANPIEDLFAENASFITKDSERGAQELLKKLNRQHESERPGDSRLDTT